MEHDKKHVHQDVPGLREIFVQMASTQNKFVSLMLDAHVLMQEYGVIKDVSLTLKPIPLSQGGDLMNTLVPEIIQQNPDQSMVSTIPVEPQYDQLQAVRAEPLPATYRDPETDVEHFQEKIGTPADVVTAAIQTDMDKTALEHYSDIYRAAENRLKDAPAAAPMDYTPLPGNDAIAAAAAEARDGIPMPTNWGEWAAQNPIPEPAQPLAEEVPDMPTPVEEDVVDSVEEVVPEAMPVRFNMVGKFLAPLLRQYLTADLIRDGVGALSKFKRYREDLTMIPVDKLVKWPTGLYLSHGSGVVQLLLNIGAEGSPSKGSVVIPALFMLGQDVEEYEVDVLEGTQSFIIWSHPDREPQRYDDSFPDNVLDGVLPVFGNLVRQYLEALAHVA